MKRWLWRIAWGTSLAFAILVAALWMSCYEFWASYHTQWRNKPCGVAVGNGHIECFYDLPSWFLFSHSPPINGIHRVIGGPVWGEAMISRPLRNEMSFLGFLIGYEDTSGLLTPPAMCFRLLMPLPFVLILCLVLPIIAVIVHHRRAWLWTAGQCPRCGYDLRASADVCPECGEPIPPTQESSP